MVSDAKVYTRTLPNVERTSLLTARAKHMLFRPRGDFRIKNSTVKKYNRPTRELNKWSIMTSKLH